MSTPPPASTKADNHRRFSWDVDVVNDEPTYGNQKSHHTSLKSRSHSPSPYSQLLSLSSSSTASKAGSTTPLRSLTELDYGKLSDIGRRRAVRARVPETDDEDLLITSGDGPGSGDDSLPTAPHYIPPTSGGRGDDSSFQRSKSFTN